MKKGRYAAPASPPSANKVLIACVVILSVALVVTMGLLLTQRSQPEETIPTETTKPVDIPKDQIGIPGFEYIDLTADTTKQNKVLGNPAANTCLFRLTLLLEDGTELWHSDYIRPGKNSDPIELAMPLAAGEYPATLKYECFAQNLSMTPLNGAEINLILRVK